MKYKIIRFFKNEKKDPEFIRVVSSLREAQEHCNDSRTRGFSRKHGEWFDGYDEYKGIRKSTL